MSSMMTKRQEEEKKKRYLFLGAEAAGLVLSLLVTPWLGIPLMGLGAYWGWNWFKYRVKNSMRF